MSSQPVIGLFFGPAMTISSPFQQRQHNNSSNIDMNTTDNNHNNNSNSNILTSRGAFNFKHTTHEYKAKTWITHHLATGVGLLSVEASFVGNSVDPKG